MNSLENLLTEHVLAIAR